MAAAGRTCFELLMPGDYLNRLGIRDVLLELDLYGEVAGSLVATIVGHKGGVGKEGSTCQCQNI